MCGSAWMEQDICLNAHPPHFIEENERSTEKGLIWGCLAAKGLNCCGFISGGAREGAWKASLSPGPRREGSLPSLDACPPHPEIPSLSHTPGCTRWREVLPVAWQHISAKTPEAQGFCGLSINHQNIIFFLFRKSLSHPESQMAHLSLSVLGLSSWDSEEKWPLQLLPVLSP